MDSQTNEPTPDPEIGQGQVSFPSPPDVFPFASRVLLICGFSEWMRHTGEHVDIVEFCREGDEGSSSTIVLQDSIYLEWFDVLRAVDNAPNIEVEEFLRESIAVLS